MYKNLSLILLAIVFVGCGTFPQLNTQPTLHTVDINIRGDTPVKVDTGNGVNRSMEVPNEQGKLSQLSFIAKDLAFMKIFSGLSVSDVTRMWNDFCVLEVNYEIRTVNLFINSPGGDAFSGLALADQIMRAKRKGFTVIGHASGIVASAAVPVLAVCTTRFAAPGTIFMVHEAALWKWPGRETASDIVSQGELMKLLSDRYIGILVKTTKLSYEEWKVMEAKTKWFSSEQALEWGLIDSIE